jgi:hypothetical protein
MITTRRALSGPKTDRYTTASQNVIDNTRRATASRASEK